ncbi:MAG: hypothetical protein AVDCRST_MAG93-6279, partial [uncultured Chloroflexia bacterium]
EGRTTEGCKEEPGADAKGVRQARGDQPAVSRIQHRTRVARLPRACPEICGRAHVRRERATDPGPADDHATTVRSEPGPDRRTHEEV